MLRLGYIYYELSDYDAAKDILNKVRKTYPNSSAAKLVGKRLNRIQREGH